MVVLYTLNITACGSEAAINQAKPINQRPKGEINQRFLRD